MGLFPKWWEMMKKRLEATCRFLEAAEFVDLTHAFHPGIPHGSGFEDEQRELIFSHEPGEGTHGDGFQVHRYSLVGQWGTHVDPPIHFSDGGRALDEIEVRDMVLPLCVLDCAGKITENPDYEASVHDLQAWETLYGRIPYRAFVALRTDWSKRWPDPKAMRPSGQNGELQFPGWSVEALNWLSTERDVVAIGHETTDTDPGFRAGKGDFSAEALWLKRDRYQIELLTNLDQLPPVGGMVVVSFPKVKDGSGFPARVFAILPGGLE